MKNSYKKAFTLMELIIVVGMVGVLAGISAGVINIKRQQEIAQEASAKTNIKKVADALLAYYEIEETFPDEGPNLNPIDSESDDQKIANKYISIWPKDFKYNYDESSNEFALYVENPTADDEYIKYSSTWDETKLCTEDTDLNDPSACILAEESSRCGDGVCSDDENCELCNLDCPTCPPTHEEPICGDGECNGEESCGTCSSDCGTCEPTCGDGTCNGSENCYICSQDCGSCCGNNICEPSYGESCSTCSTDCKVKCGDNICEGGCGETCETCSKDCGTCPIIEHCGNGKCEPKLGENSKTCPQDCGYDM